MELFETSAKTYDDFSLMPFSIPLYVRQIEQHLLYRSESNAVFQISEVFKIEVKQRQNPTSAK